MSTKAEELETKRAQLKELKKAKSKATCSSINSSAIDVRRETEIEELEEEISRLEKDSKK